MDYHENEVFLVLGYSVCKVFCTHDWYAFVSGAEIFRIKKSNFVDNPEDI